MALVCSTGLAVSPLLAHAKSHGVDGREVRESVNHEGDVSKIGPDTKYYLYTPAARFFPF